jgi:2-keto-4-pentenoate hydratase
MLVQQQRTVWEDSLDQARVAEAAGLLVEARLTGKPLLELPDACKPTNAADANAIIDAITDQLDEVIVGWKIGFLYAPRQAPFLCPMFQSRVFESPARVPLSLTPSRRVEPEICFRLIRDLPERSRAYRAEEVAEAVVACPSLEIVDTRFDTSYRSIRQMLDERKTKIEAFADHITTGAYVVGEGRADWQDFDFASIGMVMRTPQRLIVETTGGHAFVDPFLPCVVLANELRHRGGMQAGQIMVTGSFSGFFEVATDEPVTAEFAGFGSAEATFVNDA